MCGHLTASDSVINQKAVEVGSTIYVQTSMLPVNEQETPEETLVTPKFKSRFNSSFAQGQDLKGGVASQKASEPHPAVAVPHGRRLKLHLQAVSAEEFGPHRLWVRRDLGEPSSSSLGSCSSLWYLKAGPVG